MAVLYHLPDNSGDRTVGQACVQYHAVSPAGKQPGEEAIDRVETGEISRTKRLYEPGVLAQCSKVHKAIREAETAESIVKDRAYREIDEISIDLRRKIKSPRSVGCLLKMLAYRDALIKIAGYV